MSVAAIRMLVGALGFLGVLALGTTGWPTGPGRGVPGGRGRVALPRRWLVGAVVGNALTHLTFFVALQAAGVVLAVVLQVGLGPVATGILERVLGDDEVITARWVGATLLAVSGCLVILLAHDVGAGPRLGLGVLAAVVSAVAYAMFSVCGVRAIRVGYPAIHVMTVIFAATAGFLAPALLFVPWGWVWTGRGAAVAAFLGLAATTGAYWLVGFGMRHLSAAVVATLTLTEPVTATLVAGWLLCERITLPAALGVAAVGTSVVLLCVPARSRRPRIHAVRPARVPVPILVRSSSRDAPRASDGALPARVGTGGDEVGDRDALIGHQR